MDAKQKANVDALISKAASDATTAPEAVNFAQAACNAANALRVMAEIDRAGQSPPK